MTDLPPGWAEVALSDVASIIAGQAPPGTSYNTAGEGIPLFQGKTDFGALRLREPRLWTTSPSKIAESEDVLLSVRAPVGPTNLASTRCAIGRGLAAIRGEKGVSQKYLLYALRASEHRLLEHATGTTFSAITSGVVRDHRIPLAPTAEQDRIVAAIEEQFSRLDAGVAALERVRRKSALMRAAIYEAAVTEWVGEEYREVCFGEVLREPLRNGHSAKADSLGSIPILTLTAVTCGDFGSHNVKMTAADPHRVRSLWLQPGDLLIERSNTRELVGTACLYRGIPDYAVFPDLVIRARVDSSVMPEYAELVLKAPRTRRYFQQRAQGISGTMPKIDQGTIEALAFNLPSLEKQAAIVQEADTKLTLLASLEATLELAAKRSSALRSSVLAAAFSGNLVPQDPTDEPASALLQRIAAERASSNGHKTRRGRKPRALREEVPV